MHDSSKSASQYVIKPLKEGHIRDVIDSLRIQDRLELFYSSGLETWYDLYRHFMKVEGPMSRAAVSYVMGEEVAAGMWGALPSQHNPHVWIIWMVSSRSMLDSFSKAKRLLKETRSFLREVKAEHPEIHYFHNWVWAGNTTHVRWLDSLGVQWGPEEISGGEVFKSFLIKAEDYNV